MRPLEIGKQENNLELCNYHREQSATEILPSLHAEKVADRNCKYARLAYKSLADLVDDYEIYRSTDDILIFQQLEQRFEGRAGRKRWVTRGVKKPLNKGNVGFRERQTKSLEFYDPVHKIFGLLASKRGNPAYEYKVKRSLEPLAEKFDDVDAFDYHVSPYANMIFLTITDDTKTSRHEQILNFNKWWGQFTAWLRCKFGKLSAFIATECYDSGYLHAHAIIIFDEMYFKVFEHWFVDKKTGKDKCDWLLQDSAFIASGYQHGFLKIKAVTAVQGAINYLVKYITKSMSCPAVNMDKDSKVVKTLATLHAYGKRAFAVSGKFREALNSISKSLTKRKFVQSTLMGGIILPKKCVRLGSIPADLLGFRGDRLHYGFSKYQLGVIADFLEHEKRVKKRNFSG